MRGVGRDFWGSAVHLVPWNVLATMVLLGTGLGIAAGVPGNLSLIALLTGSSIAGVCILVLCSGAADHVRACRISQRALLLRAMDRRMMLRGSVVGMAIIALPILLLGQLASGLAVADMVLVTASLAGCIALIAGLPVLIILVPALAAFPEEPARVLVMRSLVTCMAHRAVALRRAGLVAACGVLAVGTIVPMLTIFTTLAALIGARMVVAEGSLAG